MLSLTSLFHKRPLFSDFSPGVMTNLKVKKQKKIAVTLLLSQRYLNCDPIEEVFSQLMTFPVNVFFKKVHSDKRVTRAYHAPDPWVKVRTDR